MTATEPSPEVKKEIAERRKEVIENRNYNSTKISELSRIVGVGLAGLYLLFSTSTSEFAVAAMSKFKWFVVVLSAVGTLVIVLEYIHYVLALKVVDEAADRADDPSVDLFPYTPIKALQYRIYQIKHRLALIGSIGFIALMVLTIVR